jgi:hypothetical protein
MTLDLLQVDLSRVFADGHAYVALSRARSAAGLYVLGFQPSRVRADPRVVHFHAQVRHLIVFCFGGSDGRGAGLIGVGAAHESRECLSVGCALGTLAAAPSGAMSSPATGVVSTAALLTQLSVCT